MGERSRFFIVGLLVLFNLASIAQPVPIGYGWARNSVNSPVFRKNSVASIGDTQYTSYYDASGSVVLAMRKLGSSTWMVNKTQYTGNVSDAHNSISIAVDGDGFLHMAWDHHGHPLRYAVSTEANGLVMGTKQNMVGNLENTVTYPEFFRLPDGDLIFIYRDGWSGNANCVINRYSTSEKKWSRLHNNLISGQSTRSAYWQSCVDASGVIHVSWVWRETADVASNHDMCYAKSTDGGYTWYKSTGEQYALPITASTAEYIYSIPQNSELINQTSIYATSDSKPYIASYWTDKTTGVPQYQLIYLDNENQWQNKAFSNRKSTFSLSGGGTKKIPISRPQVMVDEREDQPIVLMLYRDNDRDSKVSMNVCSNIYADTIDIVQYDITDFSVGDWEPTYDTDLWKSSQQIDIFVQKMQQGDGETLSNLAAQPVYVWRVPEQLNAIDTISSPPIMVGRPSRPLPRSGSKNVATDTTFSWTAGSNAAYHEIYLGLNAYELEWTAKVQESFYKPENLLPETKYYWKVNAVLDDDIQDGGVWFFTTDVASSLKEMRNSTYLKVYPQPANDYLFVSGLEGSKRYSIFNLNGQNLIKGQTNGPIGVSQLEKGIYLLLIDGYTPIRFNK